MTQEEKAKAYDEALERARKIHSEIVNNEIIGFPGQIEGIFPQLRESEDERIRKAIIELLKEVGRDDTGISENAKCMIAYLEKQKEPKPIGGIYWHAIKRGEKLPCRAYIWNPDYEKYHDCWEGRLIPNLEKICVGADTWYLPTDDVKNLPREGVDELPEEQKEQKPAWSEEDEEIWHNIIWILKKDVTYTPPTRPNSCTGSGNAFYTHQTEIDWLKSLRPSWKPSEEQMDALKELIDDANKAGWVTPGATELYEQLKKL